MECLIHIDDISLKLTLPLLHNSSLKFSLQECLVKFQNRILVPLENQNGIVRVGRNTVTVWVQVDIPADAPSGVNDVTVTFAAKDPATENMTAVMKIDVAEVSLPDHGIRYTRWFYADCIAQTHGAEIYSEEHWGLIEKYIAAATDLGINMILVPIHTPPLDTMPDRIRPCVQLVDIEYTDGRYTFSTEKLARFIEICKKHGVRYFEMAHMYSQWGAAHTPNIMVTENGVQSYRFGWHTSSDDPRYSDFLGQYIPAVIGELERQGVDGKSYFHVSDEPDESSLAAYRRGYDVIRPLVGNCKIFDALSHREFWEKGVVKIPVTREETIHEFLECPVEEQWVYYCCLPQTKYPNSFLGMPCHRIRVIGFLIYKYDIKGFLHWGFNFYNSSLSVYPIDPYITTSADGAFPSGDGFIVYPGVDEVFASVRGAVMRQALEDIAVCRALEEKIGRDAVVELIDKKAGCDLRFDDYPKYDGFCDTLREEMIRRISQ